ncbi:MAG: FapA family protein [Pseudomonadota bacterium]
MIEKIRRYDHIITKIAFSNKLIDKAQLAKAYSIQKKLEKSGDKVPIDEIFSKYKMIPEPLIEDLRTATKRSFAKGFGSRALKKGLVTKSQVDAALGLQAKEFMKNRSCSFIGEIMVDQGMITEEQRQVILKEMEILEKKETGKGMEPFLKSAARFEKLTDDGDILKSPDDQSEGSKAALIISEDRFEAKIVFSGDFSMPVSMDEIEDLLEDGGIDYNLVDMAKIKSFLNTVTKGNYELVVAKGERPVPGKAACITHFFDTDYLGAGRINEDGTIDYKDRGSIPRVNAGDLIAEKIPSQPGRDGFNVYGESIPASEPEDKDLICDSGVELSKDGLKVFAKVEGQPNVTITGKLSVFDEFNVKGDVDYNTGNIEFDGNINVEGVVKDGFTVRGGNLTAKEIHGATIYLKGDLTVNGGIFGAGIQTEGQVIARYVKDANIKSYGDVVVDKEILDSKIRTSGKCIVERGKIISSLITAKEGIDTKQIGTDVSPPCTIKVGQDEHIRKIIQGFDYKIQKRREELEKEQAHYESLLEEQRRLHVKISEFAQAQDRAKMLENALSQKMKTVEAQKADDERKKIMLVMEKVREKSQDIGNKIVHIFSEQERILEEISASMTKIETEITLIEKIGKEKSDVSEWSKKEPGNPVVVVRGEIYGGTKLFGPHALMTLDETEKNVMIKEVQYGESEKKWKIEIIKASGMPAFKKA